MRLKHAAAVGVAALGLLVAGAAPSSATSDSSTTKLAGGITIQANAWNCNFWSSACSWATSSKVNKRVTWVKNTAEVSVSSGTISVSVGSGSYNSGSSATRTRSIYWTNTNANISDLRGQVRVKGGLFPTVTTCSYAYLYNSSNGVKGGATACT
ncbi:hypothetical protein [Streptomyces sp. MUM 2J]|uniref:hypothetical protein n=1 Tax=Streptomyces sp. MUM 2J TaxID=2791987 RepID=UPI001F0343B0|nr:hypothetical protein [Streptomyces sp. MUM 2J]MCH0567619.1 hypothetical protein [Streptomyces sp. MUM 2J]